MRSVTVALLAFASCFGGALFGMIVGPRLPSTHLTKESQKVVKLGMGMIATLSGLVLGLLVSTAKSAFDTADNEMKEVSAKLVFLDHVLARYGPETMPARTELRRYVALKIDELWPSQAHHGQLRVDPATSSVLEAALGPLVELSPTTDAQRELKKKALALASDIAQARWLLIEQNVGSVIPTAFLVIVVFWLTILFISFGLFAPRNSTTIAAMLVCALSVATALYLVQELGRPLGGTIELSSAPARNALAQMGR